MQSLLHPDWFVLSSQLFGQVLDFCEVPLHLAPSVPERMVRIRVERPLESPHAVLKSITKSFVSIGVGASWNVKRSGNG